MGFDEQQGYLLVGFYPGLYNLYDIFVQSFCLENGTSINGWYIYISSTRTGLALCNISTKRRFEHENGSLFSPYFCWFVPCQPEKVELIESFPPFRLQKYVMCMLVGNNYLSLWKNIIESNLFCKALKTSVLFKLNFSLILIWVWKNNQIKTNTGLDIILYLMHNCDPSQQLTWNIGRNETTRWSIS